MPRSGHPLRALLSRDDDTAAGPSLTPMLDVVFIMLVFFIVTATFVREHGIDVNPPEPTQQPTPTDEPAVLARIAANDQISIEGKLTDERLVVADFTRLHAERPQASVVVIPHESSSTQAVVKVLDGARQAGFERVNFAK